MGTSAGPLPADEVAVRGRHATLTRSNGLAVGGQAHRAARRTPFEAGGQKGQMQAFGFGVAPRLFGARHDPRRDAGCDTAACDHAGGFAQVAESAVGTRADEDAVDSEVAEPLAGN